MHQRFVSTAAAMVTALGLATSVPAIAAPIDVVVDALLNSSSGTGVDLDTGLDLVAGDRLRSTVDPLDCWSAGADPRVSNANGLDGFSPAPCQPTANFGVHSQDDESFPFGALVARIGAGDWFMLGTDFDALVNDSGRLFLVYWDSNNGDNTGSVTARLDVNPSSTVPTPGGLLLLGTALLALGASRRVRRR
jgi:hypothetical protein